MRARHVAVVGGIPEGEHLASAVTTQYPPPSDVAKMAEAGLKPPAVPGGGLPMEAGVAVGEHIAGRR